MHHKRSKKRLKNFLFIILGTAFFLAVYFLLFFSTEQLTSPKKKAPAAPSLALAFGSFFNTFSSPAEVDQEKTSLYQDWAATAVFYEPDYEWREAAENENKALRSKIDSWPVNDFDAPDHDRRCLGTNCLEQKGNKLYYRNRLLSLPAGIKEKDIAAVSIAALEKRWLVGFTLRHGEEYEGRVFYFDGRRFKTLDFPASISSPYFGLFGFGGEEDDFLVIYGAYQGIAYRVRPEKIIDISKFFDIRVMDEGFKAEVIRVVRSGADDDVSWYVFSATSGRPSLIKLWQNQTNEIVGEAVFDNFFSPEDQAAIFQLSGVQPEEINFLAKVMKNGRASWRVFSDRGFKNNQPGMLVFDPIIHDGDASPIMIEKIAVSRVDIDAGSAPQATLAFSSDGQDWQEIALGRDINFNTNVLERFFLRITLPAYQDKFYSPFLEAVLFDYYCWK